MKVKITDFFTSFKIMKEVEKDKVAHYTYYNELKYGWAFRVHHHTKEELEYGHSKNPELITMPMEEFCGKVGIEMMDKDKGKTIVAFPKDDGIAFFMSSCPAYEVLPDGFLGDFVEVDIN